MEYTISINNGVEAFGTSENGENGNGGDNGGNGGGENEE